MKKSELSPLPLSRAVISFIICLLGHLSKGGRDEIGKEAVKTLPSFLPSARFPHSSHEAKSWAEESRVDDKSWLVILVAQKMAAVLGAGHGRTGGGLFQLETFSNYNVSRLSFYDRASVTLD